VGQQGSASGSLLLDLDGLEVVSAELVGGERQLAVQTTATVVGCVGCGVRATPHGRRMVRVRDLPIGGRPVVLAGASGSGAVVSRPAGCGPGPSGWSRSAPGRC
jgi:hypothetical protein